MRGHLEDALLMAFDLEPPERQLTGGSVHTDAAASLTVLLRDPTRQLRSMRPDVASWWERRRNTIQPSSQ